MSDTTFIYTLNCPETGRIRYVGKSDNPFARYYQHLSRLKEKSHKTNWIKGLQARGLQPYMELLDEVPIAEWEFWEREYIRVFRMIGMNLVNESYGGEGGKRFFSEATRLKMSIAAKARGCPISQAAAARGRLGRKDSEETKRKRGLSVSKAKKGIVPPHLQTPEVRAKIKASLAGRAPCEKTRAACIAAVKGTKASPETRAKLSVAHKIMWEVPGYRERMVKVHTNNHSERNFHKPLKEKDLQ